MKEAATATAAVRGMWHLVNPEDRELQVCIKNNAFKPLSEKSCKMPSHEHEIMQGKI